MAYALTWLPEVLEGAGLKVAEVTGWRTRGRSEMGRVRGVMCHHTATRSTANMPTLRLLIDGRADLSGPLAQLGLGRDGTFYVVAAGRANHAGAGQWQGVTTGNSSFIGIEAENAGGKGDAWPPVQIDAYQRGAAAILKHVGALPRMCCGHREYAPHRKSDPLFNMDDFRAKVAAIMAGAAPPLLIAPADDKDRPTLRRHATGERVIQLQRALKMAEVDGSFGGRTEAAVRAFQSAHGIVPDGIVGPKTWAKIDTLEGK